MEFKCPGGGNFGTPSLKIKKCPNCGADIELFSTDVEASCYNCGFVAYSDMNSCIFYCEHARECIGPEAYDRIMSQRDDI